MTWQTYQGADQSLPIEQGVTYRGGTLNSPVYTNAVISQNIDPSKWWYFSNPGNRCSGSPCYAAGDFFRPAMNTATVASVPFIVQSPSFPNDPTNDINDLLQTFIHDPQIGNATRLPIKIESFTPGADMASRAVITPAHLAHIAAGQARFSVSMMMYQWLLKAGLVK